MQTNPSSSANISNKPKLGRSTVALYDGGFDRMRRILIRSVCSSGLCIPVGYAIMSKKGGRAMQTTDWSFDFASLPRWDNREKWFYTYDAFYEVPGKDMLCCIYSVAEVSMLNYEGFLAILRNKEKPELVLNPADICFCVNFSQSADGRFLFLQPSFYFRERGFHRSPGCGG